MILWYVPSLLFVFLLLKAYTGDMHLFIQVQGTVYPLMWEQPSNSL